jgi:hypothetical protein
MQIAFYKGQGNKFNQLIRWWTKSPYSHVELVINGTWYSSSHMDGGVRSRRINPNPDHWDIYDIDGDENYALSVFSDELGAGYDWTGIIFSQIMPFGIHKPFNWFCNEIVGEMLRVDKPHRYSPGELKTLLTSRNNGETKLQLIQPHNLNKL